MYENKVNGKAFAGEFLGGNIQFFTVSIVEDITGGSAAAQKRFDKVIEVISLNGQPIILGPVTGSGPYVFRFANEHEAAWSKATLEAQLLAHAGVTATVTVFENL